MRNVQLAMGIQRCNDTINLSRIPPNPLSGSFGILISRRNGQAPTRMKVLLDIN